MTALSFIIPAYNEEKLLPLVLSAIKDNVKRLTYEVILVDNGSTDSTPAIARDCGARVMQDASLTIGGLRNLGASVAVGRYLIFLDADVLLSNTWENNFESVLPSLETINHVITGSRYGVRENPSWIEKYWFLPMTREKANYINSGHMIVRKDSFQEIGGFDETLTTGEDWELCMRARKKGFIILNNPALKVVHEGYPKTLWQFIRREKWHGIQDVSDFRSFLRSQPAKIAVLYGLSSIFSFGLSLYFMNVAYAVAGVGITSFLCVAATIAKRRQYPLNFFWYYLLYHTYFIARILSIVTVISGRKKRKQNVL